MNGQIQRFRFAATGRWAVSLRTYLLVFPFGYLVSTERELIFNSVSMSRAALIALAGELAGFLYLFLAQALFLGKRHEELQPISRCFFVWSTTGLVRGLFVALYANWAFGYGFELWRRIPGAVGYTTVVMALAALYFGSIDRKRTELRALHSLSEVLAQEETGLLEASAVNRKESQGVLQRDLLPQATALKDGIAQALVESKEKNAAVALSGLYEQSVKISHQLDQQKEAFSTQSSGDKSWGENLKTISYWSALFPQILSVRITSIFFVLGAISGQFPRNGLVGVAAGVLGLIPLLMVIAPISQLAKRGVASKKILFPIGFIGAFLISYGYNLIQPSLGFKLDNPYIPWYSALKTVYGLYFASVIASLLVDSGEKREIASDLGLSAIEKINLLSAEALESERKIFEVRFGTLQGKISGVTMALHLIGSKSLGEISQDRKIELLANANELLSQSLSELEKLHVGAP